MTRGVLIDQPGEVRAEDALDVAAVDRFLKERVAELTGQPEVAQYPGGASNLTYLLRYPDRDLVLRRPPFGAKIKSAHDVLREARIMAALMPVYPYVPEIVALGEDQSIIGCDFYVMDRLKGIILRRDIPPELGLDAAATRKLCCNVLDRLIGLHMLDPKETGLDGLGKGTGLRPPAGRRLERALAPGADGRRRADPRRARLARPDDAQGRGRDPSDPQRLPLRQCRARRRRPAARHRRARLGDGDTRRSADGPLRRARLLGPGRRRFRLPDQPPPADQRARHDDAAEVIAYYREKTGLGSDNLDFYEVFGQFRLAVIIQQIYKRFVLKQTTNPRYAAYGQAANDIGRRCQAMIAKSGL